MFTFTMNANCLRILEGNFTDGTESCGIKHSIRMNINKVTLEIRKA